MRKIDSHAHFGSWPFAGADAGIEDLTGAMAKYEIDAFLLSSSSAIMYDFSEGNQNLFEVIEHVPGLFGYVVVNANYVRESVQEIKKYAGSKKLAGVKYHPDYCRRPADCDDMSPLYAQIEELDLPVLIHTFADGLSSPLRLLAINRKYPRLKLIAAHMGGPRFDLGIQLAGQANENVFLEICSTDISVDKIRQAVDRCGADRVLFGTDYSLFDPSYTIGAVESSELSQDEKQMIYYRNAARIFQHLDFSIKSGGKR
jgi:uncharacterized protein